MNQNKLSEQSERSSNAEIYTQLILEFLRLWSSLERHGRAITKPFGQTPARWQVLGGIWAEPRTVPQIARRMGISRQSVQRVADLLVGEGLVRFIPNPDHKRSGLLEMTDRGLEIIEAIDRVQIVWSNEVAEGLDAEDLRITVKIIQELTRVLDETNVPTPQSDQTE